MADKQKANIEFDEVYNQFDDMKQQIDKTKQIRESINEITISAGFTVSIAQFENYRPEIKIKLNKNEQPFEDNCEWILNKIKNILIDDYKYVKKLMKKNGG